MNHDPEMGYSGPSAPPRPEGGKSQSHMSIRSVVSNRNYSYAGVVKDNGATDNEWWMLATIAIATHPPRISMLIPVDRRIEGNLYTTMTMLVTM